MKYRPHVARAPAELLRQARPLRQLFAKAQRIDQLQRLLDAQLQPAARNHCRVASWENGSLLLIVDDSQWATRLRYQQRRLQRQLITQEAFFGLQRIIIKVRPQVPERPLPAPPQAMTASASRELSAGAEGISDPRLREALQRLARHVQED